MRRCYSPEQLLGSGMISLPMVLANFGIFQSCLMLLAFASFTYITALIRADLNILSHAEFSLREVGRFFNCPLIGNFGDFLLKLLSFSLLSAYMFGASSIINSFSEGFLSCSVVLMVLSLIVAVIFMKAANAIAKLDKVLFIVMFASFISLVIVLLILTPAKIWPSSLEHTNLNQVTTMIPVIFTSFGFQGSMHSITKMCANNAKDIKRACLWGSLIPTVVYITWTSVILIVVANTDIDFLNAMISSSTVEVGDLIKVLSNSTSAVFIRSAVWTVSFFAIITSILGVGIALRDMLQNEWALNRKLTSLLISVIPALIAFFIPSAFIRILNISGIILSFIAIIVPTIISFKMRKTVRSDTLLIKHHSVLLAVFVCGVLIICLGIFDILS